MIKKWPIIKFHLVIGAGTNAIRCHARVAVCVSALCANERVFE